MFLKRTLRFTRRSLPHWEVESGRYFVTVRCAGTLPINVIARIGNIHRSIHEIDPGYSAFAALQRRYFETVEKYLDRGAGMCLLQLRPCADAVRDELVGLAEWAIGVPHFTVMPNHWHALLVFPDECERRIGEAIKRVKGRTGRIIRRLIGGTGPIWQREWFDHWIRIETEWERCVAYVRANPVKAGLIRRWQDHPWTR